MKRIFVVGDSISVHYGDYLSKMLSENFICVPREGMEEALQNINAAVGGNGGDSRRVLEFLTAQQQNGEMIYDILLFNCGLHDIKRNPPEGLLQVPIDEYKENLEKILSLLKKENVFPVFINTTPVNDEIHHSYLVQNFGIERFSRDVLDYNKAAEKIMKDNNIDVIDLFSFTAELGEKAYCDHVHYNEDVREKQAIFIAETLMSLLKD